MQRLAGSVNPYRGGPSTCFRGIESCERQVGSGTGNSPGNKLVSRLFPSITDGVKRRHLLGRNPSHKSNSSCLVSRALSDKWIWIKH